MEHVSCPCKNCEDRNSDCHSKCEEYKKYFDYRRHLSKKRKEYYDTSYFTKLRKR